MNLTGFQNLQQQGLELELAFRRQVLQDPTSQQGFNSGSYPQSHIQLPSGDQISSGGYLKNFDHFQSLQTPFLKSPSTFLEPVDQQMNLLLRNDSLLNNPSFQQQNHLYLQQQQQQHQQYNQLQFHQQQQQQSQLWAHQQQLYQDQQQRLLLLQKQQEQQYLEQQHQFKQILQTQQQQLLQLQQQTRHLQNQFQTQVSSSNLINLNPLHTEIPQQFQQQKYLPLQQESFFKPQQFQFGLYEQYKQGQQTPNQLFHHSIPMQLTKKVSEDTLGTQQILQMQKIEEPSDVTLLNLTATPKSLYDTDQRQSAQETYLDLGSRQEEIKGNILKSAKSILGIKEKEDNFLSNQCLELSKPEISSSQRDQQQSTSSIPTQVLTVQNSINQLKQDDNSKTSRWIPSQNQLELDVLKKQQKKNIDNSSQDKIKQQREQQRVDEEKIQIDEQVQLEDDSHGKSKKEGNQKQQQQYEQKQGKFQKKRREIKPYKIVKLKTLPKEDQLRNYILAQETKNVSKNICLRLSKFASAEKTKFSSISKLREYLLRNSDRDDARNMINYLQYEFLIDIAHQTRNKTKIIYAKYRLKFINGLKDLENFKQLKF